MFSLNNSNLNFYKPNSLKKTNTFTKLKPNTNLKNYGLLSSLYSNSIHLTQPVLHNTETNTWEFETTTEPQIILTPDKIFYPAEDITNPQPGEFIFSDNKIIIISDTPLPNNVTIITQPLGIKSFKVNNIPQFLYNLPVQGGFSISDSFQDHPSSSFVFITNRKNIGAYRSRFRTGTKIELYNYAFRIISYTEEISPDTNEVTVSINLRGLQEFYSNKPILLRERVTENYESFTDPECSAFAEAFNEANPRNVNIQTLAKRAGTNVRGISFYVDVPPEPSDSTTTTLSTEIEKYLNIKTSFVDYTRKDFIEVKKINSVRTWSLNSNDLLTPFNTNVNSNPIQPITNNNILPEEIIFDLNGNVPNTITQQNNSFFIPENLANIPTPSLQNSVCSNYFNYAGELFKEEQVLPKAPKYIRREPKILTDNKGDLDVAIPPENVIEIRDLTLNFDNGGVTKTLITTTTEDGLIISERTLRFGFAYTALNVYKTVNDEDSDGEKLIIESSTPQNYWKVIEDSTISYDYDKRTGYLLGYNQSGRRLLRYQVEDDSLPTVTIPQLDIPANEREPLTLADQQRIKSFNFIYVPIYGAKRYFLVQHRDYYSQFEGGEKQYKKCLPDGSSVWVDDPTFVESMFVLEENEEKQCFSWIEHPDNILEQEDLQDIEPGEKRIFKPPLITGEETYNRNYLKILTSQNTRRAKNYSIDGYPEEDRFEQYTSNFSAQEPGFSSIVENTTFNTNNGIPSIHTRKPPQYELEKEEDKKKEKEKLFRYIFYTHPYNGLYPRIGSVGFEKAKNIQEVERAVQFQLKIEDMRNSLTSSTSTELNLNFKCGDKVIINIDGLTFKRRILNLTHNFIIDGITQDGTPNLISEGTSLTLCLDRDIPVFNRKERILDKRFNEFRFILNEQRTLGGLLPKRYRTRGNYYATQ